MGHLKPRATDGICLPALAHLNAFHSTGIPNPFLPPHHRSRSCWTLRASAAHSSCSRWASSTAVQVRHPGDPYCKTARDCGRRVRVPSLCAPDGRISLQPTDKILHTAPTLLYVFQACRRCPTCASCSRRHPTTPTAAPQRGSGGCTHSRRPARQSSAAQCMHADAG